jgi:hypothetical protein
MMVFATRLGEEPFSINLVNLFVHLCISLKYGESELVDFFEIFAE